MECMRCGTEMFPAALSEGMHGWSVYLKNKKPGLFGQEKTCGVTCFVCPECGYTELRADAPEELRFD